jgi:hypothetical protein
MSICLRRREFIAGLGGAAARRQRSKAPMSVIGFLDPLSPNDRVVAEFRRGLEDAGYVDGQKSRSNSAGRTVNWRD